MNIDKGSFINDFINKNLRQYNLVRILTMICIGFC